MIFNDNIARPYIYLITFNESREYYFGYREQNKVPAHLDIGVKYFTSSSKLHNMGFIPGFDSTKIIIEIINEFEGANAGNDAFDSEQGLIWWKWGDSLLLNGNVRRPTGNKRFKRNKGWHHRVETCKLVSLHHADVSGNKNPMFGKYGNNNPKSDKTIYNWVNKDGREEKCTRFEFCKKYNLNKGSINMLVAGRNRILKGWKIKKHHKDIIHFDDVNKSHQIGKIIDKTIYKFIHFDKVELMTQADFCRKYNLRKSGVNNLIHKRQKSCQGWEILF